MKINKEGYGAIAIATLIVVVICAVSYTLLPLWAASLIALIFLVHYALVVWFFREPTREQFTDEQLIYAPADGKVVVIEEVEEKEYLGQRVKQVSIFMSITNVHINWYPVRGEVEYFKHHHGSFLVAWHPKSSQENERTTTVINTGREKILFRQIAGYVARRIVSYAEVGAAVEQNQKCGFIKFGSRIDLMLPLDAEILVSIDQKVTGSQTPVARLKK